MKKQYKCIKQFMDIKIWTIGGDTSHIWHEYYSFLISKEDQLEGYSYIDKNMVEFLKDYFEEVKEEPEYEFSKFIVLSGDNYITILWKKLLISRSNWEILYWGNYKLSGVIPKYITTTFSELKAGDVFILERNLKDMCISNFSIFIWKDTRGYYTWQFLWNDDWIEYIWIINSEWRDEECIKFIN